MKVRESGMPDRGTWEKFFEPSAILHKLGIDASVRDAAEFGCGYGTFSIPAAAIIRGTLFAFDIEHEMIRVTNEEAIRNGLTNINVIPRDFVANGTGLESESVDYAMLFNILHVEDPVGLLAEAYRIVRNVGALGSSTGTVTPRPRGGLRWRSAPVPSSASSGPRKRGFANPSNST